MAKTKATSGKKAAPAAKGAKNAAASTSATLLTLNRESVHVFYSDGKNKRFGHFGAGSYQDLSAPPPNPSHHGPTSIPSGGARILPFCIGLVIPSVPTQ